MSIAVLRPSRAMIALIVLSVGLFAGASTISAHSLGGKFPHTRGALLPIGYTQSGGYADSVSHAVWFWGTSPTRVWMFQEAYATSEADFYTQWRSETWWGLAVHNPCSGSGCTYRYASLYLNSRTLGVESAFTRHKVATHELGHALGLAHACGTCTWYTSIMKQGYLSYNTPQQHDINDTNGLYPF